MDASLMSRLKKLETENQQLKIMYAEERLKSEIVKEALEKSGEAISVTGDGQAQFNIEMSVSALPASALASVRLVTDISPSYLRKMNR